MSSLTVLSPAKLNLYLRVLGKRPDGYHNLYTLFHRISLCDKIVLKKKQAGFSLRCNLPGVPTDGRNLIAKAYRLLQKEFPSLGGVSVRLHKKIPVGAGLGGGSSNAAFFLIGMNRLYRLRLSKARLQKLGRQLGADVPFFLEDVNQAVAWNRGDRIRPRPSKKRYFFLLVIDNKPLSTKKVFESYRLEGTRPSLTKASHAVTMLCNFLDWKIDPKIAAFIYNDLEKAAFSLRPSIRRQIAALNRLGIEAVRMSGSGPTVFILLPHKQEAKRLAAKVRCLLPSTRREIARTF